MDSLEGISIDHETMNAYAFTLSPRGYSFLHAKCTSCLGVFVVKKG
jgi:hypothetical protein